jgi:hypothetical protein
MVQVFKYGLIMLDMKVSGERIKLTVVESFGMLMVIFMRVNGKMIKQTVMVSMFMSMALNTKVIGKMTCRMDKEWKAGKMEVAMKVAIRKE